MSIRVVKVGGSLLDWPPLPHALQVWLSDQSPAFNVLIAGGGALADAIRAADRNDSIGPQAAHWLCIDAMSETARILAAVLPHSRLLGSFSELWATLEEHSPCNIVLDASQFLREEEPRLPPRQLPHDWSVTSDSIAARVAGAIAADELVLLKSTDPPANTDQWSAHGFVDSHFAIASANLSVRAVNLRVTLTS